MSELDEQLTVNRLGEEIAAQGTTSVELIAPLLVSDNQSTRVDAVRLIGHMRSVPHQLLLLAQSRLTDPYYVVRVAAVRTLAKHLPPAEATLLLSQHKDDNQLVNDVIRLVLQRLSVAPDEKDS